MTLAVESRRFGCFEVEESAVLRFDGLPGFPGARRFAVLRHDRESPFAWLVCLDEPELGFVVTNPFQFFPDYRPELEASHRRAVEAADDAALELFAIANVGRDEVSLNLAAPLLVNPDRRRATQAILERGDHPTRAPIRPLERAAEPRPPAEANPGRAARG